MAAFDTNDPNGPEKMRQVFGPGHVDEQIRQAIHLCWMMLPEDRQTIDELEKQIRRIVDRALKDLRDDADQFGLSK